jgi:iron complex outermembrane receptor protein
MKTSLFVSVALLAFPTAALAQDPAGETWVDQLVVTAQPNSFAAEAAVTGTRTPTPLTEVPQSVQVLNRTLIEEQELQSISEALVNVSGVTPSSDMELVLQGPLIRGFAVNYYLDGMPTYGLPTGVSDPATLLNAERIEVAKGPTSTLYGGGAGAPLSGIINIVSRSPGAEFGGSVGLRGGSDNTLGIDGELDAPFAGGAAAFRISGLYEEAESYINVIDSRRSALFPTLRWDIGEDTRLVLRGQFTHVEQQEYSGLPAALTIAPGLVIDRFAFAGAEDAPRTEVDNQMVSATLTHRFSDTLKGEIAVSRYEGTFHEYSTYPVAQFAGTTYFFGSGQLPSETEQTFVTASLLADFGQGSVRHRVLFGADYDATDYYGAMGLNFAWGVIDYATPASNAPYGAAPAISEVQRDKLGTLAVYVQDQIAIGDRLDITAGLRWTRLDVKSRYTSFGVPFVDADDSYDEVTPRIGATWKVSDGISLFAGYSEGFHGTVVAFGVANPKPETSQSYEAGLKFAAKDVGLSGTIAAYSIARQNVITSDPLNPFASIQTGEQRAQGYEADLVYEPNRSLSVLFNYAFTDAEVTEDNTLPVGDQLRRVPRHSGRLAARYRFSGSLQGLEFGGGLTATSSRQLTLPNTTSVDGLTLVDAQASYDFGRASVSLSVINLTDEDGFEPYSYFAGQYVAPTQPRSAYITLRARF